MLSGQSHGTDVYWLDPGSTGSPLLALCDMSTDGGKVSLLFYAFHTIMINKKIIM